MTQSKSKSMSNQIDNDLNNPDNYVFGIFYYNPKDKRVILPKLDRYRGYTINTGNIYTWLILLGVVVAILLASIL